ncbi:MAG: zinc metalloprotease [Lysobacter sp.]
MNRKTWMYAAGAVCALSALSAVAQQTGPSAVTVVATPNGYSTQPLIKIRDEKGVVHSGLRCGTPSHTPAQRFEVERRLQQFRAQSGWAGASAIRLGAGVPKATKTVPVRFHVVTGNSNAGNVTDAQIQKQIQVLNAAYSGRGFRFTLAGTDRTRNVTWYNDCERNEMAMKNALAINPAKNLNIYTCNPPGLLGFAYLPDQYPESSKVHGVVMTGSSMPGGSASDYNEGDTATHEVGHYLGLEHTFENGCVAPGDYVADTPPQASPSDGCPVGRDSCAGGGLDPIHNFMDYSYDSCMTEFTTDQSIRMQDLVATYKPSLGS